MELFLELLLCSLALFGLWSAMRLLAEYLLGARCIAPSVTLRTREDADAVMNLLEEAEASLSCRRGGCIVVLCDEGLTENGKSPSWLSAACRRYGAVCYVVHAQETSDANSEHV